MQRIHIHPGDEGDGLHSGGGAAEVARRSRRTRSGYGEITFKARISIRIRSRSRHFLRGGRCAVLVHLRADHQVQRLRLPRHPLLVALSPRSNVLHGPEVRMLKARLTFARTIEQPLFMQLPVC